MSPTRQQRVPVVTVITPPVPFVTVADLKAYQIIEHTDWDATRVPMALNAAMSLVDGPRGWLGRALAPQALQLATYAYSEWGCHQGTAVDLPCPPHIEITAVEYEIDGSTISVDSSAYRLQRGACQFVASIPSHDELRITYRAGYVGEDGTVAGLSPYIEPKELQIARMAILLLAGDYLKNSTGTIANTMIENPAVKNLLAPLRVFAIA